MLEYNEITVRKFIIWEGEPCEVLDSHVFRKQQRKPVNAVKMRNLISGRVIENSFHVSEKAEEAELSRRKVKFLYQNRGQWWFTEEKDPSKRFELAETMIGSAGKFLKPNSLLDALVFEEKIIGVSLPVKVELKVTDAPNAVKGNTAKGGDKLVTLETGATITTPMFVAEGDIIRINTETGEYVERVNEKSF